MLRTQTVLACVITFFTGALVLPACSAETSVDAGPSCTNGTKDDGEVGVDCGGVCTTLCTGAGCTKAEECTSGKCENGMCGAPAGKACGVGATPPVCDDGQACELDKDCKSGFCKGSKCETPPAESHTNGMRDSGETGIDCGGSVKATKPCPDGQNCLDNGDCVGTCKNAVCGPIGPMDGKKNQDETDIDCGGTKAPKCANGKTCAKNDDCVDDYCPIATNKCTAPTYSDGVQNGNETDIDCGGTGAGAKKCAETKKCLVDTDCNGACRIRTTDPGPPAVVTKTCIDIPSCKNLHGGDTCGLSELEFNNGATHESCCTSLPVPGFVDADHPGKTVYLDKYEITAGRMRAFIDAISAANGGVPNIKGWVSTHRPAVRWNTEWEKAIPSNLSASNESYSVSNPTASPFYPGEDYYDMYSILPTYHFNDWNVTNGPQTINVGLAQALGFAHFFPEWTANPTTWTYPDYSASHGLNCINSTPDGQPETPNGSAGYSTYWFDSMTMKTVANAAGLTGVVGKVFTKDQMDEKSMNCSPLALFAAFCVWDGGQLATAEVSDAVTSNESLLAAGMQECGPGGNTINTRGDASGECPNVPGAYYPDAGSAESYDKSFKIAAPGRSADDDVSGWKDLKGNLVEAVLAPNDLFDHRGYGIGWGTLRYHKVQSATPRFKNATTGARCMRFK